MITTAGMSITSGHQVPIARAAPIVIKMKLVYIGLREKRSGPLVTRLETWWCGMIVVCCNLEVDPAQASVRYVFHWLSNEHLRLKSLGEGSQSNLNAQKVKSYPIAIPSLEEQERIVAILDKFDALLNDLSIGLPAEIEARRQQYEYYRDRLLTFEEAVA